jgi:hypothetical protein
MIKKEIWKRDKDKAMMQVSMVHFDSGSTEVDFFED